MGKLRHKEIAISKRQKLGLSEMILFLNILHHFSAASFVIVIVAGEHGIIVLEGKKRSSLHGKMYYFLACSAK